MTRFKLISVLIFVFVSSLFFYYLRNSQRVKIINKTFSNIQAISPGCASAVNITDVVIEESPYWQASNIVPDDNQTLTDIPIEANLDDNYVIKTGFKADLVRIVKLTLPTLNPNPSDIESYLQTTLTPSMEKTGYVMVSYMNGQELAQRFPALEVSPNYYAFVFRRDAELFSVEFFSQTDSTDLRVNYLCSPDVNSQLDQYAKIATYSSFSPSLVNFIDIWEYKDRVYLVNVIPKRSISGHANYLADLDGRLVSLYEGQEHPPCKTFILRKIGKGMACYDSTTKTDTTVNY